MSARIVYFNGRLIPESEARVSIYDSALVMGDMAYEVTRTIHGRPFRLRQHLDRLAHTLSVLRIALPISFDELEQATLDTLAANLPSEMNDVDWNIIHNISRGPARGFAEAVAPADRRVTVIVSCVPLVRRLASLAAPFETGVDLIVPSQPAIPGQFIDPTIKTRSRWPFQLAQLEAEEMLPGSTAVLVDPQGYITEATSANVFVVRGGALFTAPEHKVLSGITRGLVIELANELGVAVHETDVTVDDALGADELFITSTSVGILHARSFNRLTIADGRRGPIAARLCQALEQAVGLNFAAQARLYADRFRAAASS